MYERNGSNAGKYGVKYFAAGAYSGFVAAGLGTMMQNGANAKNNAKSSQTPLGENANAAKNGAESDTCPLKQKTNNTQIISNKFPNDNQIGRTYDFTISDGKIILENGVQDVDFIIDMDGNLHIGSGHSYLAGGQDVQAAGTMKVNSQGYIRNITNLSGHFRPTVSETLIILRYYRIMD